MFDGRGSTRGFAVARLLIIATLFWYVTGLSAYHPTLVDVPVLRRAIAVLLMVATWFAWIGYRTRAATVVIALCWGALHLYWGTSNSALNNTRDAQLLQALIVLALSPCGRSLSVDRWLALRRAARRGRPPPPERGPLWTRWLMIASLSSLYAWTAVELATSEWLSGLTIERFWVGRWGSSDTLAMAPSLIHALSVAFAWQLLTLLVVVALCLWVPRWRWYAVTLGVLLHLLTWPFFGAWPLTVTLLACYPMILPVDWVHDFIDAQLGAPANEATAASPPAAAPEVDAEVVKVARGAGQADDPDAR